jgi:hypothetical protein
MSRDDLEQAMDNAGSVERMKDLLLEAGVITDDPNVETRKGMSEWEIKEAIDKLENEEDV